MRRIKLSSESRWSGLWALRESTPRSFYDYDQEVYMDSFRSAMVLDGQGFLVLADDPLSMFCQAKRMGGHLQAPPSSVVMRFDSATQSIRGEIKTSAKGLIVHAP